MVQFNAIYGFTESDEISLLLGREFDMYNRSVEKLVSLSAAVASSTFTTWFTMAFPDDYRNKCWGLEPIALDSRIWFAGDEARVIDYFRWRASDAVRCGLNSWAYWTLRKAGKSAGQATSILANKGVAFKNELLFKHGINFEKLPLWQKRGIGAYWRQEKGIAVNRKTGQTVATKCRKLYLDTELVKGEDYGKYVAKIIGDSNEQRKALKDDSLAGGV